MIEYTNSLLRFTSDNSVMSDCNDITFYNSGLRNVLINGIKLTPHNSLNFNANEGEKNQTKFFFKFTQYTFPQLNLLTVIRKQYVHTEQYTKPFIIDTLNYVVNGSVFSDCQDITFINTGTNKIRINSDLILTAGQSLTLSANVNEVDKTKYFFNFDPLGFQPHNSITILRKKYLHHAH